MTCASCKHVGVRGRDIICSFTEEILSRRGLAVYSSGKEAPLVKDDAADRCRYFEVESA